MKQTFYILIFILSSSCSTAQFNPEPKQVTERYFPENEKIENVTPALKKKKGFTNHEELIDFLNTQKANHPNLVRIEFLGKSQKGYEIPIIYIGNTASNTVKVKVWMQGGLHGNEPGSTEGLLYLIYKLLNDDAYKYLFDRMELAIVPMANIDGYLKNDRYAANGLDLNRDQTKLMATESIILKRAFSNYNPQVALDFHEYNAYRKDFTKLSAFGITSAFDVMFLYSNNLNVPPNLRVVIDTVFVEEARHAMDLHQLRHHDYVSTHQHGGEIHFSQGSTSPRSSATSYALSNTISALIEVRGVNIGRTSFKRRINTTFLVALSFLETTYANQDLISSCIAQAIENEQAVVVKTSNKIVQDTLLVIDLENYTLIPFPIAVKNAKNTQIQLSRPKPDAYILLAELAYLVEKLSVLGLHHETLEKGVKSFFWGLAYI